MRLYLYNSAFNSTFDNHTEYEPCMKILGQVHRSFGQPLYVIDFSCEL